MVIDEVSLFNLALNAIGSRHNISTTSEHDRGAEVCRLWYPVIRDQVLAAAHWPSCKAHIRLALVSEKAAGDWTTADPEPGYTYAYGLPADMLHPRYLSDFSRFSISSQQKTNRVLNTNTKSPILSYTFRNTSVSQWENELQMAIAYGLAANIVMPLTGKPSRAQFLIQQANDLIITARVEAANDGNEMYESTPSWIAARGYANPGDTRYYYPYGALLSQVITK